MIEAIEQAGNIQDTVCGLIHELGGNTHAVLRLEGEARQIIQSSTLREEAKDFLLATILGDELEITLHASEEDEPPYSEVLFGPPSSLRGLQCYTSTLNEGVLVSARQNFDPNTATPISPDSCRRLNHHFNQDNEATFNIIRDILAIAAALLQKRPEGLKVVGTV